MINQTTQVIALTTDLQDIPASIMDLWRQHGVITVKQAAASLVSLSEVSSETLREMSVTREDVNTALEALPFEEVAIAAHIPTPEFPLGVPPIKPVGNDGH